MNRIMNRNPAEMIDELMYSPMNPHFPYHSTFPQNSQNNYPNFVEPQYDSMYTNGPVYPLPTQTLPGLEGMDGDNKKYLTQEDQSVLMAEFMQESKPSTDAKRTMAQKLGVDPSKVSNWFQNRRARAKLPKQSGHREGDEASNMDIPTRTTQPVPTTSSGTHHACSDLSYDSTFTSAGDFHPVNATSEFENKLVDHHQSSTTESMGVHFSHDSFKPMNEGTQYEAAPELIEIHQSDRYNDMTQLTAESHLSSLFPQNMTVMDDFPMPYGSAHKGFDQDVMPTFVNTEALGVMENPSSNNSAFSSKEELNNVLTPPTPVWTQTQDRRESESSELANDIGTFHLNQSQSGLGISAVTNIPVTQPFSAPATRLTSSESSPEQLTVTFTEPPADLAARRRHPRPAALRPDTNRSQSYGGPLTLSPRQRKTPPASRTIRHVKSTGHNLNVSNSRIRKRGPPSAQISPASIQVGFEKLEASAAPDHHAFGNNSLTGWHHDTPVNGVCDSRSPHLVAAVPSTKASTSDLHSSPHYIHDNSHSFSGPTQFPTNAMYSGPPQSAPPYKTSFFDSSPATPSGSFTPPSWPARQQGQFEAYHNAFHLPVPHPDGQFAQHSAQHSYGETSAQFVSALPIYHNGVPPNSYPAYTGCFSATPPAAPTPPVQAPFEIKVDVGPEPLLRSKPEKIEFENTFSEEYPRTSDKK